MTARRHLAAPLFFFVAYIILSNPSFSQADETKTRDSVWSNSWREFQEILTSPFTGTWEGYSLATVFAGALAVGLHNDITWYHQIQAQRNEWQNKAMVPVTLLGDGLFHVAGYAALYKYGSVYDQKTAAMAVEGQMLVAVISQMVKAGFTATRPGENDQNRQWFTLSLSNRSFASGHTMTAFCAAAILGDAYQIEWIAYPAALLVGYSRIYNQQHWPLDVIAGAGIGLLIGHAVLAFHQGKEGNPGMRFSVLPGEEGGRIIISWHF
ncbi:phosphatase PAP2 family protein [candidate division FCPU426 bacterium]|nr:phosphatase PAP2 family protein [candidate division FCPU426 bacterium]